MLRFVCFPLISILLCCSAQSSARAQVPGEAPVETMEVAITLLSSQELPELFYRDLLGNYLPVEYSTFVRGRPMEVAQGGKFVFYAEQIDEKGEPVMVPVRSMDMPRSPKALITFFRNKKGELGQRVVDDSAGAYGANTVRLVNTMEHPVLVNCGGSKLNLKAGEANTVTPTRFDKIKFDFQYAWLGEGDSGNYLSPLKYLRFKRPEQRLLVLFTYLDQGHVDSEGLGHGAKPVAYRLYDTVELNP